MTYETGLHWVVITWKLFPVLQNSPVNMWQRVYKSSKAHETCTAPNSRVKAVLMCVMSLNLPLLVNLSLGNTKKPGDDKSTECTVGVTF